MKRLVLTASLALLEGCAASTHATQPSALGTPRSSTELLAVLDEPGPVTLDTVVSADWEVDLSGLLNLKNPKAAAAGLTDRLEPIQVYFHVLRHPQRGVFLVDTGFERALRDDPDHAAMGSLVARVMGRDKVKFRVPLGDWLASHPEPVAGVFLTHLHLDHVGGVPDLPAGTPLYTGPGEAADSAFLQAFTQGSTDRALAGKGPLREWPSTPDPTGRFAGVIDVLGDGSVWALLLPGHTHGSAAFVVRTPQGPVLLTGDCSHTRWGWDHGVEPGTFNADTALARDSFLKLRALAAEHPGLDVRLGHQR